MWRKGLRYLFLTLTVLALIACSSDDEKTSTNDSDDSSSSGEEIFIQAAHVVSTETTQHESFLEFKKLVEERSDGRIEVEVYPDGQLGGEREMIESTQSGDIQIS